MSQKSKGPALPLVMALTGMAVTLGVFIALFTLGFKLAYLAFYLPALALAAFLIFGGRARFNKKQR